MTLRHFLAPLPALLLALGLLAAAPSAYAQRPADRPGGYDYPEGGGDSFDQYTHEGLFIRVNPGFGFGYAFSPEHDDNLKLGDATPKTSYALYGMTFAFDMSVGGVVTDNLALALTWSGNVFIEPTWKWENSTLGVKTDGTLDIEDRTFAAFLVGPSLTYWFDPSNAYISFAVGPTFLVSLAKDPSGIDLGRTKVGAGIMLQIGKEWWVAKDFGLGVSFKIDSAWNPDKNERNWFTMGGAIMFSASYN